MNSPIRVAVVDDQSLVREGFSLILESQPDIEVACACADGREFLAAVRSGTRLDVALVDIRMPHIDGLTATRELARLDRAPAVIIVTTFDEEEMVLEAVAAGAAGFLLKRCSGEELVTAIRSVAAGNSILDPEITRTVLERIRRQPKATSLERYELTEREQQVLALIGAGFNNAEISARLHLSMSTVKTHITNILAKTNSRDRVHAVILAIRAGLV